MKADKLNQAIGLVADEWIEEAEALGKEKKGRTRKYWIAAGAAAACLALVLWGGLRLGGGKDPQEPLWPTRIVGGGASESSTAAFAHELAVEKRWNEKSSTEKFGELAWQGVIYNTNGKAAPAELIGEKLGEREMSGQDIYEGKRYTETAQVYAMKGYPEALALLVRHEADENCYVYFNVWYAADSLGAYLEAFRVQAQDGLGLLTYSFRDDPATRPWRYVEFADFKQDRLWELLTANAASAPLSEEAQLELEQKGQHVHACEWALGWSVSAPELGILNHSLKLTDRGLLLTNLGGSLQVWQLEPAAAEALRDCVLKECEGVELVWEAPSAEPQPEMQGELETVTMTTLGAEE